MYTSKELMTRILSDLMQDPYLAQFKLRKSDCFLTLKEGDLRKSIELQHWSDLLSVTVNPVYGVKFGILSKWFEKFNTKTLRDQRDNSNVIFGGIEGITRDRMDSYEFDKTGEGYNETLTVLKEDLVNASKYHFGRYDSMESMYKLEVLPLLDGTRKLGVCDQGTDWIFADLRLCQLVAPENYSKLKDVLMKHFNFMYEWGEPNIKMLIEKVGSVDVILAYLDYLAETKKYS